ncbi:putative cytochrome P450 [Aaosphaeria arxii CBS 175.79]|uniref:Putative cytochrome P450 n=1 Tax=Aaosphaeria arxii CBS 175.79 TaxID=1450172 RepID=A0A6A5XD17_9PLEO|nr:putative cytochrome P450 [Aaosphaeria arxii CBS 175.79]KAF2010892.1 putative cytochrome P450 [Aaosphaeria arxii CBS 175.79]
MPDGWSWCFGHSFVLLRYTSRYPPLANVGLAMQDLSQEFADTEMFLIDLWPSYPSSIVVSNPDVANLVTQKLALPKPPLAGDSVEPIVGGPSILSMNDVDWKKWRTLLNPGFSAQKLMNHVPFIVDCCEVFNEKLRNEARKGSIFSLDEFATRLTFDIIMKVTLDSNIDYQRSEHIIPTALNTITRWHSFWDPRVLLNPLRPIIQKYYGRKMVNYIKKELHNRFEELKADRLANLQEQPKRPLSVISLVLEAYIAEKDKRHLLQSSTLDDDFAAIVSNHIRLFLFAGNDTTSSTIAFAIHTMTRNPTALSLLQNEHDSIFGRRTSPSQTAALLRSSPHLLSKCRYTLAFIKETLRLYPPAANMRLGGPDVNLTALNGQVLPTQGLNIILMHQGLHMNPRVWPWPMDFLPERWLVEPGHALYPPEGAWRAFDVGPRRCIGQELALLEVKVVLVMTARAFRFVEAYEEWGRIQEQRKGLWGRVMRWLVREVREEVRTVRGDRVYQTEKAGTHPSEGYPCRVEVLGEDGGSGG